MNAKERLEMTLLEQKLQTAQDELKLARQVLEFEKTVEEAAVSDIGKLAEENQRLRLRIVAKDLEIERLKADVEREKAGK